MLTKAKVCEFENFGLCFYEKIDFRPPKKGEYYLSGAIIAAYMAPNDLLASYIIVRPTHKAIAFRDYKKGDAIQPQA